MRTFFSLLLLFVGAGLCLLDALPPAIDHAYSAEFYHRQLAAVPYRQTYTRAECTSAAWQAWTNRMPLPSKETYTIDDLMGGLSGIGADQDSCDRPTLERAVARACGYRPAKGPTIAIPGILAMLGGAFLLGGVVFPRNRTKKA